MRKAPDRSIQHTLVSLVLPELAAGGNLHIDWLNEPPPEPVPFRWGFAPARFSAKLLLATESGKVLSSDAGAILAGKWAGSDPVRVLHDGPVMKESGRRVHSPLEDGRKDIQRVRKVRDLENYGEIWYYTKMNEDNAWSPASGGPPAPDADGRWPLRENGWGRGFAWDVGGRKQNRHCGWHRYGAWSGLVTALEAGVPQAEQAWQVMLPLAGAQGEYDMEMVPRVGARIGGSEFRTNTKGN